MHRKRRDVRRRINIHFFIMVMLKLQPLGSDRSIEVNEHDALAASGLLRNLKEDVNEESSTLPLPADTNIDVLDMFFKTLWLKWSVAKEMNYRNVNKETLAEWAREPSATLLDFERLNPKVQTDLGRLGWLLDISFLETLHMLAMVRQAQRNSNVQEWRYYVEQATGRPFGPKEQKAAILNAAAQFPFLDLESQSSESCAEPPPRTGAKRPACED